MKTRPRNSIEILSIGNELLIGHTLDTNSNWIASQAIQQGWNLQRVTQLRDSVQEIRQGIREALKRSPKLLITVGGLGPTHDDMTLRGVSQALGKPLALNKEALGMVRSHYNRLEETTSLTKPRRKMAILPNGAKPLPNPSGTAPGVIMQSGTTKIVCLPGVPREMKAIFRTSIIPVLRKTKAAPSKQAYLSLVGIIESALAPVLETAQAKYPGLYFKSHPKGEETGARSKIQLHIYSTDPNSGAKIGDAVKHVLDSLSSLKSGRSSSYRS